MIIRRSKGLRPADVIKFNFLRAFIPYASGIFNVFPDIGNNDSPVETFRYTYKRTYSILFVISVTVLVVIFIAYDDGESRYTRNFNNR